MALWKRRDPYGRMDDDDPVYNVTTKERTLKRRRNLLRSSNQSFVSEFAAIFFWCMIIVPVLDCLLELYEKKYRYPDMPGKMLLYRISWSMLEIWLFFGALLILVSTIQLVRNLVSGYEEKILRFEDELSPQEDISEYEVLLAGQGPTGPDDRYTLYAKTIPGRTRKKYLKNIAVALIGSVVFWAFYLICSRI